MTAGIAVGATIGIVASNYLYQAFIGQGNWAVATERTYFQLVAIAFVLGPVWIASLRNP